MSKILEPENQRDDKMQLSFSWLLWPGNTFITTDQVFPGGPGVSAAPPSRKTSSHGEPERHGSLLTPSLHGPQSEKTTSGQCHVNRTWTFKKRSGPGEG